MDCECDVEKIEAVHRYLRAHFADSVLSDLHTGHVRHDAEASAVCPDHHVIRVSDGMHRYLTVLTREFLQHPVDDLSQRLREWDLAGALHAHHSSIVWGSGMSPS